MLREVVRVYCEALDGLPAEDIAGACRKWLAGEIGDEDGAAPAAAVLARAARAERAARLFAARPPARRRIEGPPAAAMLPQARRDELAEMLRRAARPMAGPEGEA